MAPTPDRAAGGCLLLTLGAGGSRLAISARRGGAPWLHDTEIAVEAHPWSGTLKGTHTEDDLRRFAAELRTEGVPRSVQLGGDRSPELVLEIAQQRGANPHLLAIEARSSWTGDDPYPCLTWLLFDVEREVLQRASERVEAYLNA